MIYIIYLAVEHGDPVGKEFCLLVAVIDIVATACHVPPIPTSFIYQLFDLLSNDEIPRLKGFH